MTSIATTKTPTRNKRIPQKRRGGTRRGQATPEEVTATRKFVIERSGGRCELRKSKDCIVGVLPEDGPDAMSHGHLVHLKAKRRNGTNPNICVWGCWVCHLIELHRGGKVVPAKERHDAK